MKILFVGSRNKGSVSPILVYQADSLRKQNCEVNFFLINGKGFFGYLKNLPKLRNEIKQGKYDIIHAHYSISAILTALATKKKIIASLMGSDIQVKGLMKLLILFFSKFIWGKTIVKSQRMRSKIKLRNAVVIPNGVDFDHFFSIEKQEARTKLLIDSDEKIVLFLADPQRHEKNFALAQQAFSLLHGEKSVLRIRYNVPIDEVPYEINAADVVLLTSLWEGSPNVIKEAMACNVPIVTTDVGDVNDVVGNTKGCYICSFDASDIAQKLLLALSFEGKTDGRENIKYLDNNTIAKRLIEIYSKILAH